MLEVQDQIINAVDCSIEALVALFQSEPTRFFTENDLVCCLHRLLGDSLDTLGVANVRDKDGLPHNLIHCEYPTPFRCDMKNMRFQLRSETDRTPKGKKYKRGHYDIVLLNPTFLARHSYSAIKCQDYDEYLLSIASVLLPDEPFVLYGIELDFSRDTIKPSRGKDWEKGGRAFVTEVAQDSAKLAASVAVPGFMKKAAMLAFTKGTSGKVMDLIRTGLQAVPSARLVVA